MGKQMTPKREAELIKPYVDAITGLTECIFALGETFVRTGFLSADELAEGFEKAIADFQKRPDVDVSKMREMPARLLAGLFRARPHTS
jgi:hypothetical protein